MHTKLRNHKIASFLYNSRGLAISNQFNTDFMESNFKLSILTYLLETYWSRDSSILYLHGQHITEYLKTLNGGYTGHVFNLSRIYKQNIQATVQRINSKSTGHVANLSYIHNVKSDETIKIYKLQMNETRE